MAFQARPGERSFYWGYPQPLSVTPYDKKSTREPSDSSRIIQLDATIIRDWGVRESVVNPKFDLQVFPIDYLSDSGGERACLKASLSCAFKKRISIATGLFPSLGEIPIHQTVDSLKFVATRTRGATIESDDHVAICCLRKNPKTVRLQFALTQDGGFELRTTQEPPATPGPLTSALSTVELLFSC